MDCKTCSNNGYVGIDGLPLDHVMFGKLILCPDCRGACRPNRSRSDRDEYGLLPDDYITRWQDVYELDDSIREAKQAVREVLDRGFGWVYLWGNYGVAKSMILTIATARHCLKNKSARYVRMVDLLDLIRVAYDGQQGQESAARTIRTFQTVDMLALDEIEKTHASEFVNVRRFQIIDSRYEMVIKAQSGITLFASNVAPERLPDAALTSRIRDGRFNVIQIMSQDARPVLEWEARK